MDKEPQIVKKVKLSQEYLLPEDIVDNRLLIVVLE